MNRIYKKLIVFCLAIFLLLSCKKNETVNGLKTITIAASPTPHGEILTSAKDLMKQKGYNLVVKEFSDYVQPNLALDQGEVDANYFQHRPYLDSFNKERGTKVVAVGNVHFEPLGIYAGTKKSLNDLSNGDKVAVPNDVTNEARALLLLQDAGLIKLKSDASLTATKLDIVENSKNLEIVELEAAQIPRAIDSVAVCCMNGNYAIEAGYKATDSIYLEKEESKAASTYANIVCVKEGKENEQYVKDLMDCLQSDTVKNFIINKYNGSVMPIK